MRRAGPPAGRETETSYPYERFVPNAATLFARAFPLPRYDECRTVHRFFSAPAALLPDCVSPRS